MLAHLARSLKFYGEALGLRVFRKHLGWYVENAPLSLFGGDAADTARRPRPVCVKLTAPAAWKRPWPHFGQTRPFQLPPPSLSKGGVHGFWRPDLLWERRPGSGIYQGDFMIRRFGLFPAGRRRLVGLRPAAAAENAAAGGGLCRHQGAAGRADRRTARPHRSLCGVGCAAAGLRHHPAPPFHRRLDRQGRPAALPDRSRALSGRL